jgi:predicted ATPase
LNNQKIIITGGPGFGKTSIITELETRNYTCVHEVARSIIKEQIDAGGDVLPWKDLKKFSDLLLERRVQQFHETVGENYIFFDRGIPDIVAYMQQNSINVPNLYLGKLNECIYYPIVFIVPPWKDIYKNDNERKELYETAANVHDYIVDTYNAFGYKIVILPKVSVQQRADFILNTLIENRY